MRSLNLKEKKMTFTLKKSPVDIRSSLTKHTRSNKDYFIIKYFIRRLLEVIHEDSDIKEFAADFNLNVKDYVK